MSTVSCDGISSRQSQGGLSRTGTLLWAWRALQRELLGFRFDYPIQPVPAALQHGSLHYHVYSDRLFLEDLEFDGEGVAVRRYRAQGIQYNPLFVAWWGLINLEWFLRKGMERYREAFFTQTDWLKTHAQQRADGGIVWPCDFDWQEGRCLMRAPWISAMYQSVVISALVRRHRLRPDAEALALCERAVSVFEQPVRDGGVRTTEEGHVLYEEYPGYPLPRVLDGYLFSLLGLYDLAVETGSSRIRALFDQGIEGLVHTLPSWNYRNKWSWYGSHGYLCPPQYHQLNRVLLEILGRITGAPILDRFAKRWDTSNHSLLDKLEVFAMFVVTKNLARMRLPRN